MELDGNMYVGGLGPPFSEIPVPAGLWTAVLQQGFVGCLKDLVMNNEAVDVASYAREQDSGKEISPSEILNCKPPLRVAFDFKARIKIRWGGRPVGLPAKSRPGYY